MDYSNRGWGDSLRTTPVNHDTQQFYRPTIINCNVKSSNKDRDIPSIVTHQDQLNRHPIPKIKFSDIPISNIPLNPNQDLTKYLPNILISKFDKEP